ncbi:DUF397 domain-containing protein [Streptomyces sp. N35]|uniref:DUF397 domain-containing protein n=1 Tax=Streptomyces sp. N35 TaxID=2795730 RepID=UPI0018F74F2D|nr:DUF397 domain-containing protein [Streptomyces sp. N35]
MLEWQKSSYCGQGESCVHVAADDATVLLTESADPSGAVHRMDRAEFGDLLADIKAGAPAPTAPDGTVRLGPVTTTTDRWHTFERGVRAGEFDHVVDPPHATGA